MVRDATPADVPTVARLIRALAEYEKLTQEADPDEGRLADHLFGPHPCIAALIALTDAGEPAGFALYYSNYSTFLTRPGIYLEDLFVLPECRGQGHGKRLLAELARRAVARGCGRLEWSVLNWNAHAIAFYASLGAVPMTDWTVNRVAGAALAKLAGEI